MIMGPNTALLLIDIQKGLDEWDYYGGRRNNPEAEDKASKLLAKWRKKQWPVVHVKHSSTRTASPLHASKPGFAIKEEVFPLPQETVFTKNANSAFIGTGLEAYLRKSGITALVVVGLTTNHCISSSVRMASNLGFSTYLVFDATATFDAIGVDGTLYAAELMHQTALASLQEEFATIVESKDLLQ